LPSGKHIEETILLAYFCFQQSQKKFPWLSEKCWQAFFGTELYKVLYCIEFYFIVFYCVVLGEQCMVLILINLSWPFKWISSYYADQYCKTNIGNVWSLKKCFCQTILFFVQKFCTFIHNKNKKQSHFNFFLGINITHTFVLLAI
jgi:hypothetical protein